MRLIPVTWSCCDFFSAIDVTLAAGGKHFTQPFMFSLVINDLATDPVVICD